jgi:hypothetical protein
MLILSGVIALFYGILLAHVLSMFRLSVEAGTFLVVDVGRGINPYLTVAGPDFLVNANPATMASVIAESSNFELRRDAGASFSGMQKRRDWGLA